MSATQGFVRAGLTALLLLLLMPPLQTNKRARVAAALHHLRWDAQPLQDVLADARPLPSPLHRLQAGLRTHRARGQRRGVLLACGTREPLEPHTLTHTRSVALPGSASHCALCLRIVQGLLSDPNMDPVYLGILVMVGANQKKFKPSVKAIKELYYQKFRGKGVEQ